MTRPRGPWGVRRRVAIVPYATKSESDIPKLSKSIERGICGQSRLGLGSEEECEAGGRETNRESQYLAESFAAKRHRDADHQAQNLELCTRNIRGHRSSKLTEQLKPRRQNRAPKERRSSEMRLLRLSSVPFPKTIASLPSAISVGG